MLTDSREEMSVVVVVNCVSCAGYDVCKSFFAKLLLSKGELIVFRHLNMAFTIFSTVILSDLIELYSVNFKTKT